MVLEISGPPLHVAQLGDVRQMLAGKIEAGNNSHHSHMAAQDSSFVDVPLTLGAAQCLEYVVEVVVVVGTVVGFVPGSVVVVVVEIVVLPAVALGLDPVALVAVVDA